eukprot:515843_1
MFWALLISILIYQIDVVSSSCTYTINSRAITFQQCNQTLGGSLNFNTFWNYFSGNSTLQVLFEVSDDSKFAAFGFSSSGSMIGSNVVFGCSDFASSKETADYFLGAKLASMVTNQQNLMLSEWEEERTGGKCAVLFTRPFEPAGLPANQFILSSGTNNLVLARGQSRSKAYHGGTRTSASVAFPTVSATTTTATTTTTTATPTTPRPPQLLQQPPLRLPRLPQQPPRPPLLLPLPPHTTATPTTTTATTTTTTATPTTTTATPTTTTATPTTTTTATPTTTTATPTTTTATPTTTTATP